MITDRETQLVPELLSQFLSDTPVCSVLLRGSSTVWGWWNAGRRPPSRDQLRCKLPVGRLVVYVLCCTAVHMHAHHTDSYIPTLGIYLGSECLYLTCHTARSTQYSGR
jgi:hypothetical protein